MQSFCFPPIARADARVLILGSLPGEESLRKQEYYAQKHNAFWKIMERIFGISHLLPFTARAELLKEKHVAVWDVCASAKRKGSLDSNINTVSVVTNDFVDFFEQHKKIKTICFNGRKAEEIYRRKVWDTLPPTMQGYAYISLPSTSPANAGINFQQKSLRWQEAINQIITTSE